MAYAFLEVSKKLCLRTQVIHWGDHSRFYSSLLSYGAANVRLVLLSCSADLTPSHFRSSRMLEYSRYACHELIVSGIRNINGIHVSEGTTSCPVHHNGNYPSIVHAAETCDHSSSPDGAQNRPEYADEVKYLPAARERVQVIHSWLVDQILKRFESLEYGNESVQGILQLLSSAMLGYEKCRCALIAQTCPMSKATATEFAGHSLRRHKVHGSCFQVLLTFASVQEAEHSAAALGLVPGLHFASVEFHVLAAALLSLVYGWWMAKYVLINLRCGNIRNFARSGQLH